MPKQLAKSFVALALALGLAGFLSVVSFSSVAGASTPNDTMPVGYDISYPQCAKTLPVAPAFGIVGVNDGVALSINPCLASELSWAETAPGGAPSFYANTGAPGPAYSTKWPTAQQTPQLCAGSNSSTCAYDYGWNAGQESFENAVSAETTDASASPTAAATNAQWWLDVETGNSWETTESSYGANTTSDTADQEVLQGEIAYFASQGVTSVGIYSTSSQWARITGGSETTFASVPVWLPGYATLSDAESACATTSFTGGPVKMIQYPSLGYDGDYVCGEVAVPGNSTSVAASSTYSDQLPTSDVIGALTYTQSTGSPYLIVSSTGLVTTSGTLAAGTYSASGTTIDPNGVLGGFSFSLSVGVLSQSAPLTGATTTTASSTFATQLALSGNTGTASYTQTTGSPYLIVSSTGLVTTSGTLAAGTYSASGTTVDTSGDVGTFAFSLSVSAVAPPVTPPVPVVKVPKAISVAGYAVAGKTETLIIKGSDFYGQPRITSHTGTTSKVSKDSGTSLTVKVTVKARSRNGTFQFTIVFANGKSTKVAYVQR
jgi:hypothetical protein